MPHNVKLVLVALCCDQARNNVESHKCFLYRDEDLKDECHALVRRSDVEMTYIQRQVGQLTTARILDIGRQLILLPQRRAFVDKLAFLVITRTRLAQLLASEACRVSFVALQATRSTQWTMDMQVQQHAYLDSALATSIASSLSRRTRCLLRHRWR